MRIMLKLDITWKNIQNLSAAILLSLFTTDVACTRPAQAKPQGNNRGVMERRTIQCPTKQSVGAIVLTSETAIDGLHDIQGTIVHEARGTFTVNTPKHSVPALIVNGHGAHNSAELAGIKGIDAVKMQVIDMESDDSDKAGIKQTISDRALRNICQIQSLRYLHLDRSDITDSGLKNVVSLKNLEQLALFATDVRGETFDVLPQLPKLTVLDVGACRLNMRNLRHLTKCNNLKVLRMDGVALTREGAQYVAQCHNLVDLALPHSNSVTDYVIAPLVQLKSLKKLDLRQTRVSAKGLCQLSSLHLSRLELPSNQSFTKDKLAEVQRAFPKTEITIDGGIVVDKETDQIFAPVSKQRGF